MAVPFPGFEALDPAAEPTADDNATFETFAVHLGGADVAGWERIVMASLFRKWGDFKRASFRGRIRHILHLLPDKFCKFSVHDRSSCISGGEALGRYLHLGR